MLTESRAFQSKAIHLTHRQWRIQDFPKEGAPTPQGGTPTYDFAKFSQKLHEIERIWAPGGGRASLAPPLDPPLIGFSFQLTSTYPTVSAIQPFSFGF